MNWIPDRKIAAGGLGSLVAFLLVQAAGAAGVDVPMDAAVGFVTGAAGLVAYLVPASVEDVARKGDEFLQDVFRVKDSQR